jgi:putative peptide zinc metalloprotease protein
MIDTGINIEPLRQDLKIFKNDRQKDGTPSWLIYDPLKKNYYQINSLEFLIISNWHLLDPEKIILKIKKETTYFPTLNDIKEVANFLNLNGITQTLSLNKKFPNSLMKLLSSNFDNLYFFKIPLFNPSKFLAKFDWLSSILFKKSFYYIFTIILFLSLYLISREWNGYKNQFSYLLTLEGAILGFIALLLSKLFHEFGHAIAARRFGLSVEEMGVNLIVFWPIFYTDTTHAWKLSSRSQKIIVDSAGVIAELMLAILSTLLWSITPDGYFRGMLWSLSSTTWLITLFINLNPLMKFDGYYLLSDLLAIPNLMSRSLLVFKIKLKNIFFKPKEIVFERNFIPFFTFYGGVCWLYRFFLYLGIAYSAYIFYFKFLGILLFLLILLKMIFIPLYLELTQIFVINKASFTKRGYLICCLLVLFFLPLPSILKLPAVVVGLQDSLIYSPFSAKVSTIFVGDGDFVEANQPLIQLDNPDLIYKKRITITKLNGLLDFQKSEIANQSFLEKNQVTTQRIAELASELEGLEIQINRLLIRSNFSGYVRDLNQDLKVGVWVKNSDSLLKVVNDEELFFETYVHEDQLLNLRNGTLGKAYFINNIFNSIPVKVIDIDKARVIDFNRLALSVDYGGNIPLLRSPKGSFVTHGSYYKIRLMPLKLINRDDSSYTAQVVLDNGWNSLLGQYLSHVFSIIIRESGF